MSGIDSMTEFYVYENMQLLEQLEEILLSGQSDTGELSQEEIEEIFRAMHTIKGSSAMMGYDSLMNLTHSIEDVFDEIRSGRKLTQSKWEEVIDVVLAIIDFLKDEISKVQEGLFPQASIEELYQRSSNLLKEDIEENISYNTQVDETVDEIVDEVVNLDSNGMKIKVFFEDGCGMESIRALGVLMSLEGMHSSIKTVPENLEDDCDGEIAQNGLLLVLENPIDKEAIEKAIQGTMFLKCFEIEEPNENNKEEVAEAEVSEKIEEIEIKETKRRDVQGQVEWKNPQKFLISNPFFYSGEKEDIVIGFEEQQITQVVDWFGTEETGLFECLGFRRRVIEKNIEREDEMGFRKPNKVEKRPFK